jgi:sialate O-acetylesterase
MAVTTDIGEPNDIHPKNKQDVGKRLALLALKDTYGKPVVAQGPAYQSMKIKDSLIELTFTGKGSGLVLKTSTGFEVAGQNQKFYPATPTLTGDPRTGDRVTLTAPGVPHPVAARYAWEDDASNASLFNKEGLPAIPFRTDQWPEITKTVKYTIYLH